MHIEYFKEFIVLGKLLNYSAAAEQLFIAQPVLSRHIKMLEEYLGVRLFYRSTQNVKLTDEGITLFDQMPVILERFDALVSQVKNGTENENIVINLGLPYYALRFYLRDVAGHIERNNPDVKLKFVTADPNELINFLHYDKVDAIVVANIPFSGSAKLKFFDLFDERMGILCNINDPLAKHSEIDIKEIDGRKLLSVDNNYFESLRQKTVDYCDQAGFTPREPELLNQMESVLIEIDNNAGICVIGEHMRSVSMSNVVFIPFSNPFCTRRISLCYKKENNNPGIQVLKTAYRKSLWNTLWNDY